MLRLVLICLFLAGGVKAGCAALDSLQTAQAVKVAALESAQ